MVSAGKGALDRQALRVQFPRRRFDDVDFLATAGAAIAAMGVQRRHRHARIGKAGLSQRFIGQPRCRLDAVPGDIFRNFGQRDMAGNARGPQRAQGVELAEIVRHPEPVGEEMQFVLEMHAAFLHRLLVQRRKADGVNVAAFEGFQAGGQRQPRAAACRLGHSRGDDIILCHRFHFQEHGRAVAGPCLFPVMDHLDGRGDAGGALAVLQHPGVAHHDNLRRSRFGPRQQLGHQFRPDARGIAERHRHNRSHVTSTLILH